MNRVQSLAVALWLVAANALAAETVVTRIHDVIEPETAGENLRVMSTSDGRVYDVNPVHSNVVNEVRTARDVGTALTLVIEGDEIVQAATASEKDLESLGEATFEEKGLEWPTDPVNQNYVPTRFKTEQEVVDLFESLEPLYKGQCYQRAMLWTTQMWRERSVKSLKVFLFFTRKHIRQYNYKWWFHVTPYVLMADGQERTLDYTFTDEPLAMKTWTDVFMENKVTCPVISKYSEYEDHQESQHCYLRKLPMYYYQPMHIDESDRTGVAVTRFDEGQVGHARGARCRWFCF